MNISIHLQNLQVISVGSVGSSDTDYLNIWAIKNGVQVASQSVALGKVESGSYDLASSSQIAVSFIVQSTDMVQLGYEIINAADASTAASAIEYGVQVLSSLPAPAKNASAWPIFLKALSSSAATLNGCDSFVIAEKLGPLVASSLQTPRLIQFEYNQSRAAPCGSSDYKLSVAVGGH